MSQLRQLHILQYLQLLVHGLLQPQIQRIIDLAYQRLTDFRGVFALTFGIRSVEELDDVLLDLVHKEIAAGLELCMFDVHYLVGIIQCVVAFELGNIAPLRCEQRVRLTFESMKDVF
jgi:hypothetical protein